MTIFTLFSCESIIIIRIVSSRQNNIFDSFSTLFCPYPSYDRGKWFNIINFNNSRKKRMTILSAINYTWLFHFRDEIDGLTLKFFYVVSLDRQLLELHLLVSPLKNVEKMRLILG